MKVLIFISGLVLLLFIILVIGVLKSNHVIRYVDGYDSELESDYQAIISQFNDSKKK